MALADELEINVTSRAEHMIDWPLVEPIYTSFSESTSELFFYVQRKILLFFICFEEDLQKYTIREFETYKHIHRDGERIFLFNSQTKKKSFKLLYVERREEEKRAGKLLDSARARALIIIINERSDLAREHCREPRWSKKWVNAYELRED